MKETGGKDICMYSHGDWVEECPGAPGPNQCKELRRRARWGEIKSVMDAQ